MHVAAILNAAARRSAGSWLEVLQDRHVELGRRRLDDVFRRDHVAEEPGEADERAGELFGHRDLLWAGDPQPVRPPMGAPARGTRTAVYAGSERSCSGVSFFLSWVRPVSMSRSIHSRGARPRTREESTPRSFAQRSTSPSAFMRKTATWLALPKKLLSISAGRCDAPRIVMPACRPWRVRRS